MVNSVEYVLSLHNGMPNAKIFPVDKRGYWAAKPESGLEQAVPVRDILQVMIVLSQGIIDGCHRVEKPLAALLLGILAFFFGPAGLPAQDSYRSGPLRNEILVEGGNFLMGYGENFSKELEVPGSVFSFDDVPAQQDEKITHNVNLLSFWMMATEVTQGVWIPLMGEQEHYRHGKGADFPIYEITWYEAVEFANKLSVKDGLQPCYSGEDEAVSCDFSKSGWRLPTEAEWEYAARGGRNLEFYNFSGSNDASLVAAYYGTAGGFTNSVGKFRPNSLGLFDMSGNVWEWCWDWYGDYTPGFQTDSRGPVSGDNRVMRGGSWYYLKKYSRVTFRFGGVPHYYARDLGVRLVRNAR